MARALALVAALAQLHGAAAAAAVAVDDRPNPIYSTVTQKLRLKGNGFGAAGTGEHLNLQFVPAMLKADYKVQVLSDTALSVNLVPGKAWPIAADEGTDLYLFSLIDDRKGTQNQLESPVIIAKVIPTPTVMHGGEKVIYMTGSTKFNINGTGFRAKTMELIFDPPLEKDVDYMLTTRSSTHMQLVLRTGRKWRSDNEPGPLKLKRIDTGAGDLRIDAKYGGVTVAEVQVDLGAHGVTVESAPETRRYQGDPALTIVGSGFNDTVSFNTLKWGNSLRGKGVNYTITKASGSALTLSLKPGSVWRSNPANLPGPLKLLAVNAGVGLVPVGPTEAKKGRTVATIFEDPTVLSNPQQTVYQTHTHELWVQGRGFTRGAYGTKLDFDPPLQAGIDYVMMVFNRTHLLISLLDGRKWAPQPGILRVIGVDTGAGAFKRFQPVAVAHVASDAEDHPSGLTVARTASQILYQTAAIRKLEIQGSSFCQAPQLTFQPPLSNGVDYTVTRATTEKISLTLKPHKKWRFEAGPLYLTQIQCGSNAAVELAYGQGIVVATVLADPTIEASERKIYATHTKRLIVQGSGFSLDGTELTLRPTSRSSYEVESVEMAEMVLILKEGKSWAPHGKDDGKPVAIYVTKVDTGAGEVVMEDDGAIVARVFADPSGAVCDDSCEWALDGVCDDGSAGEDERETFDDDYGGFYGYDDDYYGGYGYDYYGDGDGDGDDDDDFLAPVCEKGTDCTDCGSADPDAPAIECTNTCQWANDDYCDDTRTSSLCDLGTDCHDCGPASKGNFTTFDDDGWWDDDENYWDDDYNWEDYESADDDAPHVAFIKSTPNPKSRNNLDDVQGVGGVFMMLLEGIVVGVGALMCGIGSWFAHKFYKGEKLPLELLAPPSAAEEAAMLSGGKANVPITPDVAYTGKG